MGTINDFIPNPLSVMSNIVSFTKAGAKKAFNALFGSETADI